MARPSSARPADDANPTSGAVAVVLDHALPASPRDTAIGMGAPHPNLLIIAQALGRAMAREFFASQQGKQTSIPHAKDRL